MSARCLRRSFRHAQARRRPAGGTWYPLAGALKNILERRVDGLWVQVLPGGGVANVKAVEIGRADIALANSVSTVDAINGEPPFKARAPKVCNLATLYPQYFQVVTLESAGIGDPAQFRGRWLATQPKGNIGEAMTLHLLRAYDMSYAALSRLNYGNYTDSVALMKVGNAEIFTLGTSIPSGAVMDLASARAIRLVEIPDDGLRRMQAISTSSFPLAPTRDSGRRWRPSAIPRTWWRAATSRRPWSITSSKAGVGEARRCSGGRAHVGVLFRILSAITPPVALAVYAANGISRAPLWESSLAALRLGATGFIISFMFVFGPSLLMIGAPQTIAVMAITAALGVICLAAGFSGYLIGLASA